MEGKVKWFNREKGYGFIEGSDGEDYFVHHSAIAKDTFLRENEDVSFDPAQTERGKQAQNVKTTGESENETTDDVSEDEVADETSEDEAADETSEDKAVDEISEDEEQKDPKKN